MQAGADRSECVRECARAIFLDNDYGNDLQDLRYLVDAVYFSVVMLLWAVNRFFLLLCVTRRC